MRLFSAFESMLPCSAVDRRWLLGGVLFVGGVGLVRALTARPKLDENSRVLVIGDSLARGMTPHFQTLAEEAGIPLLSIAESGTRIDQWVDSPELGAQLIEFDPTHVFISLGTNDAYTGFDIDDIEADVEELVTTIEETNANVIWIGAPTLPEFSAGHELRDEVLDTIEANAPHYYDSTDLDIPRGPDNLHPTAAGYAGWAGALWNWLT